MRSILFASLLLSPAAFAQSLQISGTCGAGPMRFDVGGVTPNGRFIVVSAASTGSATVPNGPCAGLQLGLSGQQLRVRLTRTADAAGDATINPNVPAQFCGNAYAQVIDTATCTTSPARLVDTPPPSTGRFLISQRNASSIWDWDPSTGALSLFHTAQTNDADCNAPAGLSTGWAVEHFADQINSFVWGAGAGQTLVTNTPYAYPKHVAVYDGTVLVMSRNDGTVHQYTSNGTDIGTVQIGVTIGQGVANGEDGTFWVSRWNGANSDFVQYDASFTALQTVANPSGLAFNNIVDFAYNPTTGTWFGIATNGEGGTGTESFEVVEFIMGGSVLSTTALPWGADGFGRNECP